MMPHGFESPSLPILYFQKDCPLCAGFAKLLQKAIPANQLKFQPLENSDAKDFELITPQGQKLIGREAVIWLADKLPRSQEFFWMLPDRLKNKVAIQSYGFLKWLRKFFRKKDCNCPN